MSKPIVPNGTLTLQASRQAFPQHVALYLRVSTEDQAEHGTIDAQRDFLRKFASLYQLPVADEYAAAERASAHLFLELERALKKFEYLAPEDDKKIILSSETRVDEIDGFNNIVWREVKPGELVNITQEGIKKKQIFDSPGFFPCSLHDMYGARRNSMMTEGIRFKDFRKEAGRRLAREHTIKADLYVGIPETGLDIAEGYAEEQGKSATEIVTRREDIDSDEARGFIGQNSDEIHKVIERKYVIREPEQVRGKKVVTVDDSNIRGKTAGGDPLNDGDENSIKKTKGYVDLLREAGATEVHTLFALPKFVRGCDMGYYIREDQLVAVVKGEDGRYETLDEQQIAKRIGADSVYYMSVRGVESLYEWAYGEKGIGCMSCMGQPHPLDTIKDKNGQ